MRTIYFLSALVLLFASSCKTQKQHYGGAGNTVSFLNTGDKTSVACITSLPSHELENQTIDVPIQNNIYGDTIQRNTSRPPTFIPPYRTDTLYTITEQIQVMEAEEQIAEKIKRIEIMTLLAVVLTIISAVAAGYWATGTAAPAILYVLYAGLAASFLLAYKRIRSILQFTRYINDNTPAIFSVDNPFLNEILKKRMRLISNMLYLFPIGSLWMAWQMRQRLQPENNTNKEVTRYVRKLCFKFILLSLLSLSIWTYLCWASFPYLIQVAFG